ncbi:MAG: sigma-70 family RNA polymerase sigma factor [Armatimonadetes bacterium]|nr:sigma-70 family RNA polymerase sigma factor [Armatimonadota bacterium]MDE2207163.1 sigma-70 family RNA polymerase sigma factor [Armatimonadota bacterium]
MGATAIELRRVRETGYRAARALGIHEDDAQDVASSFLLRWMAAAEREAPLSSSLDGGWLYKSARNHARDWLRHERRVHRSQDGLAADCPPCRAGADEDPCAATALLHMARAALLEALAELHPQERALVIGHCQDGHTVRELAAQTGTTQKAAEQRIRRARARVRVYLAAHGWSQFEMLGVANDED